MKKERTSFQSIGLIFLGILAGFLTFLWVPQYLSPPDESGLLTATKATIPLETESLLEMQTVLETILLENPENADAHYQLGLVLAVLAPNQAPSHLEQASTLDASYEAKSTAMQNTLLRASLQEDTAYQMVLVGQTLGALTQWHLAKAAFTKATEINEQYAEAWAYRGEAQQQTGEDGLQALQTALKLNPESLAVNLFLGMYWRRQQHTDLALAYFEHAAELAPGTPAIQVEIGQTLADAGEMEAALSYYEEATALAPNQKSAWQSFAAYTIDHEIHIAEIGLPAARQALLLDETDPYTLTLLGRAYALLSETELATRFYNQAIGADKNYAAAYYYLGLLQYVNGEPDIAQLNIENAMTLDPTGEIGTLAETVLNSYFK